MDLLANIFDWLVILSPLLITLGILGYKAFRSGFKPNKTQSGNFFKETDLIEFPENRVGYSDRIAYVMAELSDLVYCTSSDELGL